jgi:hypothetical protein
VSGRNAYQTFPLHPRRLREALLAFEKGDASRCQLLFLTTVQTTVVSDVEPDLSTTRADLDHLRFIVDETL